MASGCNTPNSFDEPDWTVEDPAFLAWAATVPDRHWAKRDISACRLGWHARALHSETAAPSFDMMAELKKRLNAPDDKVGDGFGRLVGTYACPICGLDTPHYHEKAAMIADRLWLAFIWRPHEFEKEVSMTTEDEWRLMLGALREPKRAAPTVARSAVARIEPVAWRYRERLPVTLEWSDWRHVGHKPQGPASDRFEMEPLYSAPQSASVSINAHEEALVELNLLRSQIRELAERCRPAVAHYMRTMERSSWSEALPPAAKQAAKMDVQRLGKRLDDIDAILGARSVAPHRSGGPIADGTPKPESASPDRTIQPEKP